MKKLCLPLFIFLIMSPILSPADPIDKIAALIRQGNMTELTKLFADNVEVSILGEENVYSKLQTAQILAKFFSLNKPETLRLLHKVNSNPNYGFGVLLMTANSGIYRISITLKETGGILAIIEFTIETEKVK
jgi:hypothetical protein